MDEIKGHRSMLKSILKTPSKIGRGIKLLFQKVFNAIVESRNHSFDFIEKGLIKKNLFVT